MSEERYVVRVQLVRSDREGEYISKSFDYEVSPTIDPTVQDPLFIRAEKFYRELQTILGEAGKVKVTDKEKLRGHR